jgi:hypothetical protein
MELYGYTFDREGYYNQPEIIKGKKGLVQFIKKNIDSTKLVVTDQADQQVLLIQDGVDLYNDLGRFGIDLGDIYKEIRAELVDDTDNEVQKPDWEILYDSIGLSYGEIRMRQRVKRACRAARTAEDVANLVKGTYFTVYFYSPDEEQCWGYFDESEFTAVTMIKDEEGYWSDTDRLVRIPRDGRVKHLRSGEDIHDFMLFDSPTMKYQSQEIE